MGAVEECKTDVPSDIYRYFSLTEEDRKDLEKFSYWKTIPDGEQISKTYTDLVGNDRDHRLVYLFKHKNLYCTTPLGFNDPYDCWVEFDLTIPDADTLRMFRIYFGNQSFTQEEIGRLRTKISPHIIQKYLDPDFFQPLAQHKRMILEICQSALQRNVNLSRIVCFSKIPDNPLMWAHYANKHEGYCLQFKTWNVGGVAGFFQGFFNMRYSDSRPLLEMSKEETITLEMAAKILLTKSCDWKYEQEVRLLNGVSNSEGHGKEYIGFKPSNLKKIILGAEMPDNYQKGFNFLIQTLPDISAEAVCLAELDPQKYKMRIS